MHLCCPGESGWRANGVFGTVPAQRGSGLAVVAASRTLGKPPSKLCHGGVMKDTHAPPKKGRGGRHGAPLSSAACSVFPGGPAQPLTVGAPPLPSPTPGRSQNVHPPPPPSPKVTPRPRIKGLGCDLQPQDSSRWATPGGRCCLSSEVPATEWGRWQASRQLIHM